MAKKIKFTRNELKAQRESLARFTRFLPTLELKKMQLQVEKRKVAREIKQARKEVNQFTEEISAWEQLFSEACPKTVPELVQIREVVIERSNIAGIFIPVFKDVLYDVESYDQFLTPPWFDQGVEAVKSVIRLREQVKILQQQEAIIDVELRKTTQRINLFRERLIPEGKEHIRRIQIYLGDVQAAAVGRAKIAKQKNTKVS